MPAEPVAAGRWVLRDGGRPMSARHPFPVHLHATVSTRDYCDTVCGLHCGAVDTAYRDLDPERVTCAECATGPRAMSGRSGLELDCVGFADCPCPNHRRTRRIASAEHAEHVTYNGECPRCWQDDRERHDTRRTR